MANDVDVYEVQLDGGAKSALSQIVDYLRQLTGKDVTPEEALQRALGTELYLLQKITQHGAKIVVQSREGGVELDLTT
jgi:hypothetical protein